MKLNPNLQRLAEIYLNYAEQINAFQKEAACKAGCAFCCTHYGHLDITTLEGLSIQNHVKSLPRPHQVKLRKKIIRNRELKEKRLPADCPFLRSDNTCVLYDSRPLSCRQLYSVNICDSSGSGPMLHRQAVALTRQYVYKLQQLDETGYSGHLTYVLHLLDLPGFRSVYLAGNYDPQRISNFGKSHGILINRMVIQHAKMPEIPTLDLR